MPEDAPPLLEVRGLAKSFGGVHAVVDCTLSVAANSVVGLIGPNGAGKSTVIDVISGFREPDAGVIRFDGREIQGWAAHRVSSRGLMRTFQSAREWKALTVMENMLAAARQDGRDALWRALTARRRLAAAEESDRVRARELLERFGLIDLKDEFAGNLSGGQKRLLEFARIVMADARMVLLDEPLAGVNPVLQTNILQAVLGLRQSGIACLLIEHNLTWIERACQDGVYVMALGRTIASGSMEELRANPAVVDAYLGEVAASA
jgi:ABC-type branched-subunit amino acid transport system ATPase component